MKKTKLNLLSWAFLSMGLLLATSCDEDESGSSVSPPTAAYTFIYGETAEDWQVVKFTNDSRGSISWAWNYGDGQTSTESEVEHSYTYAAAGEYEVSVEATNSLGESISYTQTLTIVEIEDEPVYNHVDPIAPTSNFYNTFNSDESLLVATASDVTLTTGVADPSGSDLTVGHYSRGTAQYADLKFQLDNNIVWDDYTHMRVDVYFPAQNLSPYGDSGDGALYQRVDIFIANFDFGNFWEDWSLFRDEDQQDKNTWLRYEFDLSADTDKPATDRTDLNLVGLKLGGENYTTDADIFIRNFEFYTP